jgi:hypothetical protein
MSLKTLKSLQLVVGVCITGIVMSFVMSIITAVHNHRVEASIDPNTIPTPASINQ